MAGKAPSARIEPAEVERLNRAVNSRPPCRAKRLWNLGLARCNQVLGSFSTG
jgi:hypothetical protein